MPGYGTKNASSTRRTFPKKRTAEGWIGGRKQVFQKWLKSENMKPINVLHESTRVVNKTASSAKRRAVIQHK
jgi:hypothetical protein